MEKYHIFKLGLAIIIYATHCIRPMLINGLQLNLVDDGHNKTEPSRTTEDFLVYYQGGVEGTPGIDFPIYSHIPRTSFSCKGIESGYYADLDTDCQVFHICEEERKISFLCPNGTIFQQNDLICEWWFKVNCSDAPSLYHESAEQLRADTARRKSMRKVNSNEHGAVMRTEEVSSISVKKNGKALNFNHDTNNISPAGSSNQARESSSKTRRYNDNETGNYYNNRQVDTTQKYSSSKAQPYTIKEYHVQFDTTDPDTDSTVTANTRGYLKYNTFPSTSTTSAVQHTYNDVLYKPKSEASTIEPNSYYRSNNKDTNFSKKGTFQSSTTPSSGTIYTPTTSVPFKQPAFTNKLVHDVEGDGDSSFHIHKSQLKSTIKISNQGIDSEESQITQESSSFVKNSLNSIQDNSKYSTINPYPNHRTTYSDLKQPNFTSTKFLPSISSVTPQYITTQPINNGKPFLGNRVGTNIHTSVGTITQNVAKILLETVKATPGQSTSTTPTPKLVHSTTTSGFAFKPYYSSTTSPVKINYKVVNDQPSFAKGIESDYKHVQVVPSSTTQPLVSSINFTSKSPTLPSSSAESSTKRIVDYATVYGSFSGKPSTTTNPIHTTAENLDLEKDSSSYRYSPKGQFGVTSSLFGAKKRIPGASGTNQQVFISGAANLVNTYPQNHQPGVQVKFDKNSSKVGLTLSKSLGKSTPKQVETSSKANVLTETRNSFTENSVYDTKSIPNFNSIQNVYYNSPTTTLRPRPFQKSLELSSNIPATTQQNVPVSFPNYNISSARPFQNKDATYTPTVPTPSTTSSIYKNVDEMITALVKMSGSPEEDFSAETPRPGLIVPPSAGPHTLHTLAVYFANTLDGIVKDKEKLSEEEKENMKNELTTLLTEMTVHGYNQLFDHNKSEESETVLSTTETPLDDFQSDIGQLPEIRMLARNFSLALASYLDNPDMFRKDLQQLRPTEPSSVEVVGDNEEIVTEEELLNFSDADMKTSQIPLPQPSPTWGYILATKSNDLDTKNSINPDLNTADSQSFIPRYNQGNFVINAAKDQDLVNTAKDLPQGHWTTSPSATKLWSSTFGINPASVNEHFVTTVATPSAKALLKSSSGHTQPEWEVPKSEVRYELRSLPKLALNSTQIHGILIDFMNTTTDDSSRLHRLLKKLNTTEDEFLDKMKEIESNPLTKRLILLLISECGVEAAKRIEEKSAEIGLPLDEFKSVNDDSSSVRNKDSYTNTNIPDLVDLNVSENEQDVRALQLLNSLYSIASRFGK